MEEIVMQEPACQALDACHELLIRLTCSKVMQERNGVTGGHSLYEKLIVSTLQAACHCTQGFRQQGSVPLCGSVCSNVKQRLKPQLSAVLLAHQGTALCHGPHCPAQTWVSHHHTITPSHHHTIKLITMTRMESHPILEAKVHHLRLHVMIQKDECVGRWWWPNRTSLPLPFLL
jgi:hypothetical protein